MHILLVADGRSPITKSWIRLCRALGFQVSLVSTFPCTQISELSHFIIIPAAFGRFSGSQVGTKSKASSSKQRKRRWIARFRNLILPIRYRLGPASILFYKNKYIQFVRQANPDVVHALRIPFEGMLARHTPQPFPLAVSIWGNDLTLHANGARAMQRATRKTLQRANGLAADAARDIRLGKQWGFREELPAFVVPGSGGVDLKAVNQPIDLDQQVLPKKIIAAKKLVINPRGFRPGSVRNDTFFSAIPLVLKKIPDVIFACSAMQGQPEALKWLDQLGIHDNVVLLPYLEQAQLWGLFHQAQASVSVSEHDGTPNSLLEAMASGCFPIAGDIESIREWIIPGVNGFLIEPDDHHALAESIITVLEQPDLRFSAAEKNISIIQDRAEISIVQEKVDKFYQQLTKFSRL